MGASKEKQLREMRGNESSPKERAAQQAAAEKKKTNTKYTIGVVVILIVAILAGVINSGFIDTRLAAVKTGSTSWSLGQVRYAKQTAYSQFYNNYGSLVDYLIDSETPLDEQQSAFDENMTWDEYFTEEGLSYLQEMAAYYDLAKAEGYTLSEEEQQTIDDNMVMYDTYAQLYGYTTDGYLTAMYGEGNTAKTVRQMMEISILAGDYAQAKQDSFSDSYTTEQLDAWYEENSQNNNSVTYLSAFISAETDEEGNASEEALATAKASAEAVKKACDGTVEGFTTAVLEATGSVPTESSSIPAGMGDAADWANDSARKAGDVTMVENGTGYTLYCYESIDTNDYNTVSVRHILIKTVDADEDGSISEEEKQTALDTITAIKDQWDGTEEGFATLAMENSEDSGSSSEGGLYENIYKGQMVTAFDDFCFAEHKPGDTDIVYDETYGYFFIYYVGEGDSYKHVLAKDALTGEDFTAWKDELMKSYTIEKTGLFKRL